MLYLVVKEEVGIFIKILAKTYKGEKRYYASLVENKRINGKVVQTVKANLGPFTKEQIPYLKAAYAIKKPRLVYDDAWRGGTMEQEQAEHLKNDYKHRMAVNRTLCIGLLKSDLIYILLEKDLQKQEELFQNL